MLFFLVSKFRSLILLVVVLVISCFDKK